MKLLPARRCVSSLRIFTTMARLVEEDVRSIGYYSNTGNVEVNPVKQLSDHEISPVAMKS